MVKSNASTLDPQTGELCEDAPSVDTVCAGKGPCTADKCSIFNSGENDKCGEFLFFDLNCE